MRVLAIRGRNLASLAGDFEIDFGAEPLASAGLFAISGPTGAGKSTVLDALCLALYHKTPRLAAAPKQASVPDVDGESTTPGDPRTLLRRGASEGYAEVEFIGRDGDAWRARWEVRRARARSNGRLQKAQTTLTHIGRDEVVTTKVEETAQAIEARVGLSFDQFRRAVLLAQNDFAALLKAPADERASLLEALTSTEIFTLISRRAYERRVEVDRAIQSREDEVGALQVLTDDERATLEGDILAAAHAVQAAERTHEACRDALAWHDRGAELRRRLEHAQGARDAAARDLAARVDEGRQLLVWQTIKPLGPRWQAHASLVARLASARQTLAACDDRAPAVAAHLARAEEASESAHAKLQEATAAREAARPAIEEARRLDAELRRIDDRVDELDRQVAAITSELTEIKKEGTAFAADQAEHSAQVDTWAGWQADHEGTALPAIEWTELGRQLDSAVRAIAGMEDFDRKAIALEEALGDIETRQREAEAALATAREAATQADDAESAARAAVDALDPEALTRERRAHDEAERHRAAVSGPLARWSEVERQLAVATASVAQLDREREAVGARRVAVSDTIVRCKAALDATREALDRARLLADAHTERLRQLLEAGTPCPVCGATDHPGVSSNQSVASMLGALEGQVYDAERALREAHAEQASVETRLATVEMLIGETTLARDEAEGTIGAVRTTLAPLVARLGPGLVDALNRGREALEAAIEARDSDARVRETELGVREDRVASAQQVVEAARAGAAKARDRERMAQDALSACAREFDPIRRQLDENRTRWRLHSDTALAARAALGLSDETTSDLLAAMLVRWREGSVLRDAARAAAQPLAVARTRLEENARLQKQVSERLARSVSDRQEAADARTAMAATRAACLAHDNVDDLARALEDAETEARLASDEHALALVDARSALGALEHETTLAREEVHRLVSQVTESEGAIEQALVGVRPLLGEATPSPDALGDALAGIPDDLDARVSAWQVLVEAERSATDECKRLTGDLEVWQAEARSAVGHDEARAATDSAKQQWQATIEAQAALLNRRHDDDGRRRRATEEGEALARMRSDARRWHVLADLIGSADGKKFKTYAQQVTLAVLLDYANQHLDRLAPRYELTPGLEPMSLLVVDRDFGGEKRSAYSLSGGESFLVSLALALGLASLSAERVSVESLFIDEGFGSLDADTLNMAMEALDRLQAEGRRVGLISHVHDMAERIGAQVRIVPVAPGRSRLEIVG